MATLATVPPKRLVVVEDDDEIRDALVDVLSAFGFFVVAQPSAPAALHYLEHHDADVVVTDVKMPGMSGIELCRRLSDDLPGVPVVVMTAFGDVDSAVAALRAGAYDFVTKPLDLDWFQRILVRAAGRSEGPEVTRLPQLSLDLKATSDLIGDSPQMLHVRAEIARASATDWAVLISGESGTGKELVARAIHSASSRSRGPFVAISSAAVPSEILESELFGYAKGAFTGAVTARSGLFSQADGGTLFLDEIGDLPLELQPKILRALQSRKVRPLGASQEVAFDARVLAATNKDLEAGVSEGTFREDLYFRLRVLQIELPPLRERNGDTLQLARWFLQRHSTGDVECRMTPEAERLLTEYHWPGNVRELENTLLAATALARGGRIGFEELPTGVRRPARAPGEAGNPVTLEEVERHHIAAVLQAVGWNKADAARKLGIDRATLYRKLRRLNLRRD